MDCKYSATHRTATSLSPRLRGTGKDQTECSRQRLGRENSWEALSSGCGRLLHSWTLHWWLPAQGPHRMGPVYFFRGGGKAPPFLEDFYVANGWWQRKSHFLLWTITHLHSCNTPDETLWVTKHNTEKTKTHMKEESILLGKRKGVSKKKREVHIRVNMTEICHVRHGYRELGSNGTKKGQTHI